jgi:hypothetical protein
LHPGTARHYSKHVPRGIAMYGLIGNTTLEFAKQITEKTFGTAQEQTPQSYAKKKKDKISGNNFVLGNSSLQENLSQILPMRR